MLPTPRSLLGRLVDRVARTLPDTPPLTGTRQVPGLRAPVKVVWTEGGLPHLTAQDAHDLFFAQGWLCAADRFFQMDMARRTMRGELSAVLGDRPAPWKQLTAVFEGASLPDVDHFLRQLSMVPVAAATLEGLASGTRAILDAYAAGVNAWLASSPRPLECALLGYEPEPWRPVDSVVTWKGLAFQLSWGWRVGLLAEAIRHRFRDEPARVRAFLPDEPRLRAELPTSPIAGKLLEKLDTVLGPAGPSNAGAGGSNAWALAASRGANGRPIVCGDPHLPFRAPASGWLCHLQGGGFDVAGWCVPGVPGVFIGHNERIAWSITNGAAHDASWAREELKTAPDGLRLVRDASGWTSIRAESTSIHVKGRATPQQRLLAFTENGPMFGGHLAGLDDDTGLALRWTGHLPSTDLGGLLAMNLSRSGDDMVTATRQLGAPVANVVWGEVGGRVGWRMVGAAPRFPGDGAPPVGAVPGHDHAQDWQGVVPPEDMPSIVDPPSGLVVSANDAPPAPSPVRGALFHPPWRANRVRTLLGGVRTLTLDDAMAPQLDDESGFGLVVRDRFVRPWRARVMASDRKMHPTGDALAVLDLAAGWNGHADPASPNAAACWTLVQVLLRRLCAPALGENLYARWTELFHLPLLPLLDLLAGEGRPFVEPGAFDALVRGALEEAASTLRTRCGGGPNAWSVGVLRSLSITHTMSSVPGLGALFTLGPIPWGGDVSTLNMASFKLDGDGEADVGPVFRHGVEVGDWDGYRVVLATGQSGDPASARYRDHFARWREGRTFTFPFSDRAIADAAEYEGTFEPVSAAPPGGRP